MDKYSIFLEEYKDTICEAISALIENLNFEEIDFEQFFIRFPFIELVYILDKNGNQITDNIVNPIFSKKIEKTGKGINRATRPYFSQVINKRECIITKPYVSSATNEISVTIAIPIFKENEIEYVFCADIDMKALFFSSKTEKIRFLFERFVKYSYTIFSISLILLSLKLMYWAFLSFMEFSIDVKHIFEAVILITLALAIFDLAKTIFEEEVILFKNPRKHSEIRKTITRFLASIIIAVSIEALMLLFKFSMSDQTKLLYAFGLFFGVGFLIIALGIYVFLGAKAEISIKKFNKLG